MRNKLLEIIILTVSIILLTISSCFAYSDDLFEFNLPSNYTNRSYKNVYIFSDTDKEKRGFRGFTIYTRKDLHIKKSVWDISQHDINEIVKELSNRATIVDTNKRAKLGKEKAVQMTALVDKDYMDVYILASNKYIYSVVFSGESKEDLKNSDYEMIQKSFKLKDSTTNFRLIYILVFIVIIAISGYIKYRKSGVYHSYGKSSKSTPIDYKNLTEDDFKKM